MSVRGDGGADVHRMECAQPMVASDREHRLTSLISQFVLAEPILKMPQSNKKKPLDKQDVKGATCKIVGWVLRCDCKREQRQRRHVICVGLPGRHYICVHDEDDVAVDVPERCALRL